MRAHRNHGRLVRASHRSLCLAIIGSVAILGSLAAGAQVAPPGSHVRVLPLPGGTRLEGSLVIMTDDSISVRPGISDEMITVPMNSVRTVDVSDGLHSRADVIVRDGAIGLAVGVGGMLLSRKPACGSTNNDCSLSFELLAFPVGAAGLLAGILIGRSQKSEHWSRVYERSQNTSLLVGPSSHGGVAIGLSIPFGGSAATH
jgi:hypothetical protein